MSGDNELLDKIKKFCAKAGMTESAFGRAAVNDPNLVAQMGDASRPRSLTGRTRDRIVKFMEGYRG